MYGADRLPTTWPAEWFSIQIQITCVYVADGPVLVPHGEATVLSRAAKAIETAASAAATVTTASATVPARRRLHVLLISSQSRHRAANRNPSSGAPAPL